MIQINNSWFWQRVKTIEQGEGTIKSHSGATVILFLEGQESEVGTWLETGCFQTQPLEGEVAPELD